MLFWLDGKKYYTQFQHVFLKFKHNHCIKNKEKVVVFKVFLKMF